MISREQAIQKIKELKGTNAHDLAQQYDITVTKNGKQNKGWFGQTIERALGLPINSSRNPNFGSWELKTTSLKRNRNGALIPKETMAITMIDPVFVAQTNFENSHLYLKLRKQLVVAREVGSHYTDPCYIHDVRGFDLSEDILAVVKEDFLIIQKTIVEHGFSALSGRMGELVQPRTKGAGHGSTSRAYYARTRFIKTLFDL